MKEYLRPNLKVLSIAHFSVICASSSKGSSSSSFWGSGTSSGRDDYSKGVKDGMNAHGRGGYNPGRNTSREYQEGYRHGYSEDDED